MSEQKHLNHKINQKKNLIFSLIFCHDLCAYLSACQVIRNKIAPDRARKMTYRTLDLCYDINLSVLTARLLIIHRKLNKIYLIIQETYFFTCNAYCLM